jgi:1,4-dihydroxy-2-naphthoate octaprenyltransferase
MCDMATPGQWIEGARPRTLPAAIAPVLAGTGVAAFNHSEVWWKAALAMVVALALQVGVNYANDYSDGIKGTDADRVGPLRLVGSGSAAASQVKVAAFASFGVAAVAGVALALTTSWWLVALGAVSIVAAWYYTGGSRPYGYAGLGEVMVFVFFGLVAVLGTTYVQAEQLPLPAWYCAIGIGALASAILVANNLRDIPTDKVANKLTLAVRLGDQRTRALYVFMLVGAAIALVGISMSTSAWAALGFAFLAPATKAIRTVRSGAVGHDLVKVLQLTGAAELLYGLGVFAGLLIAS